MATDELADRHVRGTEGAADVPTEPFQLVQAALPRVVALGGMAALYGPAGSGKSFAMKHFLERHPEIPHTWLDLGSPPKGKELAIRLFSRLGIECDRRAPQVDLTDELAAHLAGQARIIVFNEAQNARREGLEYLRYLHERPDARWTLVAVGATLRPILAESPELQSRFTRVFEFRALRAREIVPTMQAYHPVFAATKQEVLLEFDRSFRGILREWAKFLEFLLSIGPRDGSRPATAKDLVHYAAVQALPIPGRRLARAGR